MLLEWSTDPMFGNFFRVDTMPVLSLQASAMLLDKLRHWGSLTITLDMGLIIMKKEELQSFCSTFNKDLVLSLHSAVASGRIDGRSIFTDRQVCAFKPKQMCVPKHHYLRLQFQQHDSQLSGALCSREWNSECDWSPANCCQVQLSWGNSGWIRDEDMSG